MDKTTLKKVISLLEGTVGAKSDVTCTQFLTVLYALYSDGMTQKELSEVLDITEGAVSRNIKKLGPEGSGCLCKRGRLVVADDHVKEAVGKIMDNLFSSKED